MSEPQIERPSLADAFKGSGSSRAAGLTGLLPKSPPTPAQSSSRQVKELGRRTNETGATKRATERSPAPPGGSTEHEGVQNVAVYLEPDMLALVRAAKTRLVAPGEPDKTYDELLVDALDHISLDQLRAEFDTPTTVDSGGPLHRRTRRPRGSGGIQIQLRLDGSQRRALDKLVEAASAPSRSALVATAYRLHLATGNRAS